MRKPMKARREGWGEMAVRRLIPFPKDLMTEVEKAAKDDGQSISAWVRHACRDRLWRKAEK